MDRLSDLYIQLILNSRILLDNPTQNETIVWLRMFSLALFTLLAVRFILDQFAAHLLRKRSRVCTDVDLLEMVRQAARRLGLGKTPRLYFSTDHWPLAFSQGIFRPAVFLSPRLIASLTQRELAAVITHEVAHMRRRDGLRYWLREAIWSSVPLIMIQTLAVRFVFSDSASSLAWWSSLLAVVSLRLLFTPLEWMREKSCDDETVAVTRDPIALASALLRTNRLAGRPASLNFPATHALSRRSSLAPRVRRLVQYRSPRYYRMVIRLSRTTLSAAVVALLLFSIAFHSSEQNQLLVGSLWNSPCPSILLVD